MAKDESLYTIGGLDFTWDSESRKLMNTDLQIAITEVSAPFKSEALHCLLELLMSGLYGKYFTKTHEMKFSDLDEIVENKRTEVFNVIQALLNGSAEKKEKEELLTSMQELVEACSKSLK